VFSSVVSVSSVVSGAVRPVSVVPGTVFGWVSVAAGCIELGFDGYW
jgi:hypothetical protein